MNLFAKLNYFSLNNSQAKKAYFADIIAYSLIAITIATGIYLGEFAQTLVWAVPISLLFPHCVYVFQDFIPRRLLKDNAFNQIFLNSISFTFFVMLMGLSIVPTFILLIILSFNSIMRLGLKLGLGMVLFALALGGVSFLLFDPALIMTTNPLIAIISMTFGLFYIGFHAYFVSMQNLALEFAKQELCLEKDKSAQLAVDLSKYLSPQIWQMIFSGKRSVKLETQRKRLSVFFSDIKGFTSLSEELEAEELTDLLNSYLDQMSKIALKYGGTIDKFVGDSLMVFFGDPATQGAKTDALAAVSMAITMRKHMNLLRQHWRAQGIERSLEIRMGINTGYCTVGNFGSNARMDYTIIGREVNLASRLESYAQPGEILISHETFSLIQDKIMCRSKGEIRVKGFSRPIHVYQVIDFRRDLGATQSYLEHEFPGFSMYLDTNNIQNYDKERVIKALKEAADQLRDKLIL